MASIPPPFIGSPSEDSDEESLFSETESSSSSDLGFEQIKIDDIISSGEEESEGEGEVAEEGSEGGEEGEESEEEVVTPVSKITPIMPPGRVVSGITAPSFMNPPPIKPSLTVKPTSTIPPPAFIPPPPISHQAKPVLKIAEPPVKQAVKMNVIQPTITAPLAQTEVSVAVAESGIVPPPGKTLTEMLVKGQTEQTIFFTLRSNLAPRIVSLGYDASTAISLSFMLANKMQFGVQYSKTSEAVLANIMNSLASARS